MRNQSLVTHRRWQATIIFTLFFISVAGAAGIGWWFARESPPHQGPIVLLSVDGLTLSSLPPYGAPAAGMPALAALSSDAVVFDRAYAHAPQTLPTHASILTGQLPPEHGVRDDAGFALAPDARTLAELLRARGFATGAAVSSFLLRRETGLAQGFGFFDAELPDRPDGGLPAVARDGSLTADAAAGWLDTQGGQRSFLFLHVAGPAAEPAVARIVEALKQRRLYDRATLVLVGGRGASGAETALDESALRIPLLVKQPNREGAGRRVASPVQQIDILPTLLDLVRAPVPSGLRGRSLRPVLSDGDGRLAAQAIYAESLGAHYRFGGQPLFSMATDRHRFVRGEHESLVQIGPADEPTVATDPTAALRTALDRLLKDARLPDAAAPAPAEEDRLALLGHLEGLPGTAAGAAIPQQAHAALIEAHREAAHLAGEKKLGSAIRALQAIVRQHPTLATVHYQVGRLMARSGRIDDAIEAFREVERLQPGSAGPSIALAGALLRTGRIGESAEHADLAVARAEATSRRELATAHEVAARAALERRDPDAAIRHAASAQEADPSLVLEPFIRGRLLYDEGRYEEAAAVFGEAEEAARDEGGAPIADLHLHLGDALAHLARYPEAETHFREELRAFPRSIEAYVSLAMLYRAGHRDEEAARVLDDLLDAVPTPDAYTTAARLWTILGDRTRAETIRADARARFRGEAPRGQLVRGQPQ